MTYSFKNWLQIVWALVEKWTDGNILENDLEDFTDLGDLWESYYTPGEGAAVILEDHGMREFVPASLWHIYT